MCVLIFSKTLCEHFSLWEEFNEVLLQMYIGLYVKYLLFVLDFNGIWIFWTDFRKILKYQILWKSVRWETIYSMRMVGRTERHDETDIRFPQFCKRA